MGKSLLAVDIGNTSVKIGHYQSGRLINFKTLDFSTVPIFINKIIKSGKFYDLDIVICSVNPKKFDFIRSRIVCQKGANLWVCCKNLPVSIRHRYKNIKQLGIDRRINAYGASRMLKLPVLIISYGTAMTCDFIDSKGVFQGGMIIPGADMALKALCKYTSLLPSIHFPSKKGRFLGRNTKECMISGILEGYGSLTDEITRRFKSRFGKKIRVLATGGLAKTIAPFCSSIDILDPLHTIKSIMVLWRDRLRS